MKKLLALVLSMVMALSLTAPAFAAAPDDAAPVDGDPGFFTENGLPVPVYNQGEPVPISLNPDEFEFLPEAVNDTVTSIIGGADGPTAIITTGVIGGQNWMNTNPAFDGMDRQAYQAMIDAQKEALGGVAGQIGVMVNGEYVQFSDAVPEVKDGCTMVPVRALVEALGGETEYSNDEITHTTGSLRLAFIPGKDEARVEYPSGDGKVFPLDCAPYVKGGRTYVPVRFIGEMLGYQVGWDSAYQTVILLDRDALAEKIDQNFTILNRVQANRTPAVGNGESLQSETKGSLTVTAFDTLNGDKTYKADLSGKTLMNAKAISGAYSFTMSDNVLDDLEKLLTSVYGEAFEEDTALVRSVVTGLKDMEVIMTAEGLVWAHAPILDELNGKKNTWAAMDLGAELNTLLSLQMNANQLTMGTAVIRMMDPNSVANLAAVSQTVQAMAALYSDDKFTTSNGVSSITIGMDELAALCVDMGVDADEVKDAFKTYRVTMKVDGKGSVTSSCVMETAAQDYVPAVKITMNAAQSADQANVTMTCHIANMGEMKLELTSTQKAVSEKPASQPPKGAAIIEADSPALLNP